MQVDMLQVLQAAVVNAHDLNVTIHWRASCNNTNCKAYLLLLQVH